MLQRYGSFSYSKGYFCRKIGLNGRKIGFSKKKRILFWNKYKINVYFCGKNLLV
jgi:hypothetical protein